MEDDTYEMVQGQTSIGTTRSNKLSLKKVKASNHDGIYSVAVTNQVGEVTSDDFSVTIIEGVSITRKIASIGVVENQAGILTVVASGVCLAYQWQKYESKKRVWNNAGRVQPQPVLISPLWSRE